MPGGLAGLQAAFDGLGSLHGLRHGEGHGDVDRDAAGGGVLDGLQAGPGGGDLHHDVAGQVVELLGLVGEFLGVAVETRVGLYRQAAVASLVLVEDGLQEFRGLLRHVLDGLPADLGLAPGGVRVGDGLDARRPHVEVLFDGGVGDDRVAGGADAAVRDGLAQLVQVGGIVPERRRGVAGGVQERSWRVLDVSHELQAPSRGSRQRHRRRRTKSTPMATPSQALVMTNWSVAWVSRVLWCGSRVRWFPSVTHRATGEG